MNGYFDQLLSDASILDLIMASNGQKWCKKVWKCLFSSLSILRDQKIAISILVQRLVDRSSILDLTTLTETQGQSNYNWFDLEPFLNPKSQAAVVKWCRCDEEGKEAVGLQAAAVLDFLTTIRRAYSTCARAFLETRVAVVAVAATRYL